MWKNCIEGALMLKSRTARSLAFTAVIALAYGGATAMAAAPNVSTKKVAAPSVTWTGQGTTVIDGVRTPDTTDCDEGEYVTFVLASTKALSSPMISFDGSTPEAMIKSNTDKKGTSSYKTTYTSDGSIDLDELLDDGVVATYTGSAKPTLTVGHGCVSGDGDGGTLCYLGVETVPDLKIDTIPVGTTVGAWSLRGSFDGLCGSPDIFTSGRAFLAGGIPAADELCGSPALQAAFLWPTAPLDLYLCDFEG
jgi:hypothetical protein